MTMRTFHYAGVAEINVTLGLPRLIEIVDARKSPTTPVMEVRLLKDYASDRDKARELSLVIEVTKISHLGDVITIPDEMLIIIELNEKALDRRHITVEEIAAKVEELHEKVLELHESSKDFPAIDRNTKRILASIEMLRINLEVPPG